MFYIMYKKSQFLQKVVEGRLSHGFSSYIYRGFYLVGKN